MWQLAHHHDSGIVGFFFVVFVFDGFFVVVFMLETFSPETTATGGAPFMGGGGATAAFRVCAAALMLDLLVLGSHSGRHRTTATV